jgi:hypothetical protein
VRNGIRICNVVIIFIFESHVRVWSRVELRHEYAALYKFHIHNLYAIGFLEIPYSNIYRLFLHMKIASFFLECAMPMGNGKRICNVVIIFIFESQARVWSRVELRHEYGPLYKFHIHNL